MVMNKALQVCTPLAAAVCAGLVPASCLDTTLTTEQQDINIQNMDLELVAQMFKNYRSNVLFHLEGESRGARCGHPLLLVH